MMMRNLSAADMLDAWETGRGLSLSGKSLHLLSLVCDEEPSALSRLSLGQRDLRLLSLRERLFGPRLLNKASCPACGMALEWETNCQDLYLQEWRPAAPQLFQMDLDEYSVGFRLIDSLDIERGGEGDLLLGCVVRAARSGVSCAAEELPADVMDAIDRRMSEIDPQADIQMLMTCAGCSHEWEIAFDIAGYLWTEIDNWAERILQEVVVLSRALGWSEKDILQLSPKRRSIYLEMVQS